MEEGPSFTHIVTVPDADIDELGHANNVAYLRWVQDAAVAHSSAVGLGYEGYTALGGVFVIRRHEIDYLRSALRGDRLLVRTRVSSVASAQCERRTTVSRESDGIELARAVTIWVYVDTKSGRPTRIHEAVYRAFGFEPRKKRSVTDA
ncbi:thioesterase family protein [soil metagenome]